MANRQFIIEADGVFYLTTGRLLEFDATKAKGKAQQEAGVAEIKGKFEATSEAARYTAVDVKDADFSALISSNS